MGNKRPKRIKHHFKTASILVLAGSISVPSFGSDASVVVPSEAPTPQVETEDPPSSTAKENTPNKLDKYTVTPVQTPLESNENNKEPEKLKSKQSVITPPLKEITPLYNAETFQEECRPEIKLSELNQAEVKTLQKNLMALGFNIGSSGADGIPGSKTRNGIKSFQFYYKESMAFNASCSINQMTLNNIQDMADQSRADAKRYGVSSKVIAPIRLASETTGLEFEYMMELAQAESSFRSGVKANTSRAAGLYQFIPETWLFMIAEVGDKYGLKSYQDNIIFAETENWEIEPKLTNPLLYDSVMDLRYDPYLSAFMAAEFANYNEKMGKFLKLKRFTEKYGRTERYMQHFMGPVDSLTFFRALHYTPDANAQPLFERVARANPNVFKKSWHGKEYRSYQEIYDYFDKKFNTGKYELPTERKKIDRNQDAEIADFKPFKLPLPKDPSAPKNS